jgi:membrane protein implicated in regulation of membrane protease activity
VFPLAEPIVNNRGKIRIEDSFWLVEGKDLPLGKKVRVIGVDGVILKVEEDR